jgi:hypothetical protein
VRRNPPAGSTNTGHFRIANVSPANSPIPVEYAYRPHL